MLRKIEPVKLDWAKKLCEYFEVFEDDKKPAYLYLRFFKNNYTKVEVVEIIKIILEGRPDEIDVDNERDMLILWWD